MITSYLTTYVGVFLALLVLGYLIPAGIFHWLIHIRQDRSIVEGRIQSRHPRPEDVGREVRHSVVSLLLFAAYGVAMIEVYKRGLTSVYSEVERYPIWWLPASFVAAALLHDTYFYWTHRLMHTKLFFRRFHAGHHRSLTPTPWAILSFQPLETIFQFGFFALLIIFVPMHPAVLLAYFMFDGIVNAAGHCGHEIVPLRYREHPLLKYTNAVTHHDLHHSRFKYNFSQYFNVWDRLMNTFLDRPGADQVRPPSTTRSPGTPRRS